MAEKYSSVRVNDNIVGDGTHNNDALLGGGEDEAAFRKMKVQDEKMKRKIRILRFVSRVISTILSGFMVGSMAYSLERYLNTRNIHVTGVASIWANPTTLWPTIMLLVIAFITFFINISVVMSYWCSIRAANSVDNVGGKFIYGMMAAQIIVWAVTTGLYKYANNGNDLWGWSCGTPSDNIQPLVQSFLDFGQLCMVQTGSFGTTIVETVMYVLTFLTYLYVARRAMHKKKMTKELERRASSLAAVR